MFWLKINVSSFSFRHILEDVRPGVDPSLCDKQRQLKRAKLADSLSNQLLARPGPLELIKKNILHTDDDVEQAVKEGQIQFRPTNEGLLGMYEVFEGFWGLLDQNLRVNPIQNEGVLGTQPF